MTDSSKIVKATSEPNQTKRVFLQNETNEPYLHARLYYAFRDEKALIKTLERRKCIYFENPKMFFILYNNEAKNAPLFVPYDQVESEDITTLGMGQIRNNELVIDASSAPRMLGVAQFMYKYIDSKFAYITHIAIKNQLLTGTAEEIADEEFAEALTSPDYDVLFDKKELLTQMQSENNSKLDDYDEPSREIPLIQIHKITNTKNGIDAIDMLSKFALFTAMLREEQHQKGIDSVTFNELTNFMAKRFDRMGHYTPHVHDEHCKHHHD